MAMQKGKMKKKGMARGGAMKKKGYAKGGAKMPMVKKGGKMRLSCRNQKHHLSTMLRASFLLDIVLNVKILTFITIMN